MIDDNNTNPIKPVFKLNTPNDQNKFQPLPLPTGAYPYRLNLAKVINHLPADKMVFHLVGDTGSAKQPGFQRLVAQQMIAQFKSEGEEESAPRFLFHLGDVVYHFGEAEEYFRQFFEPYKNYPAPIFAIAGNHDADINPNAAKPYKSLQAFLKVFCDTEQRYIDLAEDSGRKTMIQPNIYYTLQTPLADIIALYSNVPKFGLIEEEQKKWFVHELKAAGANRRQKALIVCIHHAPYSADSNHGASRAMINFLEDAYQQAGVKPDIVFSGHVHNYQRFTKHYADGNTVPYVVAGAGGYVTLFPVIAPNNIEFISNDDLLNDVDLNAYCDTAHGFLKVAVEKTAAGLTLLGEYYIIRGAQKNNLPSASLFDSFKIILDR